MAVSENRTQPHTTACGPDEKSLLLDSMVVQPFAIARSVMRTTQEGARSALDESCSARAHTCLSSHAYAWA